MNSNEQEPTWGRFLVGCALLITMFGGLGYGLYCMATKENPLEPELRSRVLDPYLSALGSETFVETCTKLSKPSRLEKAPPEKMAESFAKFSQEHGSLIKTDIKSINREMVLGEDGSWLVVKVLMHFEKGRILPATYKIDDKAWLINLSTTSDREVDSPIW